MVDINLTLIVQILNFVILVALLGKFGFKPLLKVLEERKARIANDLNHAETARTEAEELKREYERHLAQAQAQAQEIVNRAVREAQQQTQAQLDEVRQQIEKQKELAKRQIEEERAEVVKELRKEVVDIAIAAASQLIAKNMDQDMNRKLIADCINQIDQRQKGR